MNKPTKRYSKKAGLPPGTLVHIGDKKIDKTRITVIDYDEDNFNETQISNIEECSALKESPTVTWINIDGIDNISLIEKIGTQFNIHSLILEDILNTGQRPKFEDLEDYIFIVLKMLSYENDSIKAEQVSFVLGSNFIISFQESVGDVFEQVRQRIRNSKGRIRKAKSDYLTYCLIDAVVDNYFCILEALGEKIESTEESLVSKPTEAVLHQIHKMKRQMVFLRRSVWPLRELISSFSKSDSRLLTKSTDIYLRDVYEHTIQIIDTIESYRDSVSNMLDTYLSSISNRMNSVMKVLTIIATIFIPLTFLAGIYGMNFKYMPELQWRWAYPVVWLIMVIAAITMLIYFKRKKWL